MKREDNGMTREHNPVPVKTDALVERMEQVMPKFQHVVKYVLTQIQGEDRLTLQQLRSLRAIAGNETGMRTTKLARLLKIASPTATRIIDGLVDRGLVTRQPDAEDRRRIRLVLALPGSDLLEQYEVALHDHLSSRLNELPAPHRQRLWESLGDLETILRDPDTTNG